MTRTTGRLLAILLALGTAAPAAAQSQSSPDPVPAFAVRPFFLVTAEHFAASQTFEAVFGTSVKPFVGGGAQFVFGNGLYAEVTASHFGATGERAFSSNGEVFGLGIPLTASLVPIEATGGYRFGVAPGRRFLPYVGAGIGSYHYSETSDFAESGDDVHTSATGYLAAVGAEYRVHRWVVVSVDAQFTHVGGILGTRGISQQVGEDNLGGRAARFRVIIGR